MKKNFNLLRMAGLGILLLPIVAYGQEQTENENSTDLSDVELQNRPVMPRLFFTNEQRRILEVVRQEVISEQNLNFDEFVPLVLAQQESIIVDEDLSRDYDIQINAYIRNRKSDEGSVWVNGIEGEQFRNISLNDRAGIWGREGLGELTFNDSREITGLDVANNSRFVLRVGQKLAGDGEASETYPVIIVKKK